jgi:hypothetical protein
MLNSWWQRFSAAIPDVKRGLAANVIRPPGDPGKPTNGSKKALNAWRHRINEARSRLTPGKYIACRLCLLVSVCFSN